ncbi:MAG: hypothetical protein CMD68_00990 [Gammaproteobacteria bacterium]|nr:hypothetical protein [Gammaproteobacteria bacterium]
MIKALAFIHKKNGISDIDFRNYYETSHAPLAESLLTFEGYERNFVNSLLNPLYESLGSISIFKYSSMEALNIIGEEMASDKGDILREDELNFMDVPKNFYVLTNSKELTQRLFKKKIFLIAKSEKQMNSLDSHIALEKISDNIIIESKDIFSISEYGILESMTTDMLEKISSNNKEIVIASSVI